MPTKSFKKFIPWDGKAPLFHWKSEQTITDEQGLADYLEEAKQSGLSLEQIELDICENDTGPRFCIMEFLEDHIHEEYQFDRENVQAINAQVNAWIAANAPYGLDTTGKYADPESLREWWPK